MKKVKENGRGGNGGRRGEARTEEKDDALSRGYRSVYKLGHRRVGSLIRHAGGGRRREEEHGGEGEGEAEIDRTIRG